MREVSFLLSFQTFSSLHKDGRLDISGNGPKKSSSNTTSLIISIQLHHHSRSNKGQCVMSNFVET